MSSIHLEQLVEDLAQVLLVVHIVPVQCANVVIMSLWSACFSNGKHNASSQLRKCNETLKSSPPWIAGHPVVVDVVVHHDELPVDHNNEPSLLRQVPGLNFLPVTHTI